MVISSTTDYKPVFRKEESKKKSFDALYGGQERSNDERKGFFHRKLRGNVGAYTSFKDAGFEIDAFTLTGKAVWIAMWAFPEDDKAVQKIYADFKLKLNSTHSPAERISQNCFQINSYAAILIPGGQGALMGLPDSSNVKELIHQADKNNLLMLSICPSPAAFISVAIDEPDDEFIYRRYKIFILQ